jgi:hypothetical protein
MVLGMHRSGTSAVTRVVGLLGADLPKNLMQSNSGNESGYWESTDLMVVHDEILDSAGSKWDDWRAFNPEWYRSPAADAFKSRIVEVLERDFEHSRLFVIKDPRICRIWPLWSEVLDTFGAKPGVVISVRNPLEVAASLKRRDGFLAGKCGLLWLRHVIDAEASTRGLPRTIVNYEDLLEDPNGVVATLGSRLGVGWPRRAAVSELEIERFITPQLRHHVMAQERLDARRELVDWVREAYAALIRLTRAPDDRGSMARLDRVRVEFDKASTAFGVTLAEIEIELTKRTAETAQLRTEDASLRQRISQLSNEHHLATAEATIVRLKEDFEQVSTALSAERQEGAWQTKRLAELEERRRIAEAGHSAAAQEARQLGLENEALRRRISEPGEVPHRQRSNEEAVVAWSREDSDSALATLSAERLGQPADPIAEPEGDQRISETNHLVALEEAHQPGVEREPLRIPNQSEEDRQQLAQANTVSGNLNVDLENALGALSAERQRAEQQAARIAELDEQLRTAESKHSAALEEGRRFGLECQALRQRLLDQSDEHHRQQEMAQAAAAKLMQDFEDALTRLSAERQKAAERADRIARLDEEAGRLCAELAEQADLAVAQSDFIRSQRLATFEAQKEEAHQGELGFSLSAVEEGKSPH